MLSSLKKYYLYIFFILTSSLVYFRWLSFNVFAYGDYVFQFSETLKDVAQFSAYNSFGLGGG